MDKRKIMKKAVELAKQMIGDWAARMALALKKVWAEAKAVVANEVGAINAKEGYKAVKLGDFETEQEEILIKGSKRKWIRKGTIEITRETEKAVQIEMKYTETYRNYKANGELRREKTEAKKYIEWLPKSQVELQNGYIFVKDWLVKEKMIGIFAN
jgi:hypothetical protein